MNKPAYLVEGDLEQDFIQTICPGCPVRKINCNGDNVNLEAISKRVGTLGRLLHKRHSPIIVVFDRESRIETCEEIEVRFLDLLRAENIQVPVVIGVPDRDIESWLLSDYEMFISSAKLTREAPPSSFEGKSGKAAINKCQLGHGGAYVPTIHGVAWLKAARPGVMRQRSPSFERFAASLSELECWWLQQQALAIVTP